MKCFQRVFVYVLRFINNSRKNKVDCSVGFLTVSELKYANLCLAKIVQGYAFPAEIKALQGQQAILRSSKLLGLVIMQSWLHYQSGKKTNVFYASIFNETSNRVVRKTFLHKNVNRAWAPKITSRRTSGNPGFVATRYWPISGRNAVQKVTRGCVRCFKASAGKVIMANLSTSRVTPSRLFLHCDIDYAGPFMVWDSKRRNSKYSKGYVVIFVCLACKAVHIELVFDLLTEAFLNAFKRFISRREKRIFILTMGQISLAQSGSWGNCDKLF